MKLIVSAAAAVFTLAGMAITAPPATAEEFRANRVTVDYIEPRTAALVPVMERMKKRGVLEELAKFLSPVKLPTTLRLWGVECGVINAFYNPEFRALQACYEFLAYMERAVPTAITSDGFTPQEALVGGFASVLLHESGHAMSDLLKLPVFGREEDSADQMGQFVALQFGKDVARFVTKGAAWLWLQQAKANPFPFDPSDTHSTAGERFQNYLCLAYGSDADTFRDMADRYLSKARAANCAREYQRAKFAFQKTILPYVDQDMLKANQKVKWFEQEGVK
jgi:putative metallopeptidase DUF4344